MTKVTMVNEHGEVVKRDTLPATVAKPVTLTPERSRALAAKARAAAFAIAEFWDELRCIELESNVLFDGTVDYIGQIAANCDTPPALTDLEGLTGEEVIEGLTVEEEQP